MAMRTTTAATTTTSIFNMTTISVHSFPVDLLSHTPTHTHTHIDTTGASVSYLSATARPPNFSLRLPTSPLHILWYFSIYFSSFPASCLLVTCFCCIFLQLYIWYSWFSKKIYYSLLIPAKGFSSNLFRALL